ncbi:hypothetical protein ES702_02728 [subsurface metagenome]
MKRQKKFQNLLVILILIILLTIFFFPAVILQKTFITTGLIQSDLMNQNYPLKAAYGDSLKKGKLLLWSPFISNGYPVFAEGQTGELYPINLLFFKFLPNLQAFNFSLLIHYFFAAFFTYLFVRKILKLSQAPGLLAALVYSLSGFFMTHLVHPAMIQVASFIPLNFLLVEKIIQSARGTWQMAHSKENNVPPTTLYVLALAIIFALQALAGHHELLYFTIVFLLIYLFIRSLQIYQSGFFRYVLRTTCYVLFSGFLAICLSAVQLLPTLELIKFSTRKIGLSYQGATAYLFPFSHLLTFIKPQDFKFTSVMDYTSKFPDAINLWETYGYVGIIPLILAGVAIVVWIFSIVKKRSKTEIRNWKSLASPKISPKWENGKKVNLTSTFIILLIISLLLALGRSTPFFKLLWWTIPGMKFFKYPTRFLIFTEFSLAILAAIGLEELGSRVRGLGFRVRKSLSKKPIRCTLYSIPYILLILTFLDLFINNRPINPTIDPKAWFQPPPSVSFLSQNLGHARFHTLRTTPFDYSLIDDINAQFDLKNLLPADFNLLFGLRQTDALAGLLLSRHVQLNHQVPNSILSLDEKNKNTLIPPPVWIRIISLQAAKFLLSPIPFDHPVLKLVGTIPFNKPLTFNIYLLTKTGQKHEKIPVTNVYIYENSQSFPRAFIVPKASVTSKDEKEILKLLSTQEINFKEEVLLEEKPKKIGNWKLEIPRPELGTKVGNWKPSVDITEDTNDKVVINTNSGNPGFLVLADTFYPGWKASIDGLPTKIYRANFDFRAIILPEGEHEVEFVYKPLSFRIGKIISLVTGGLVILFFTLRKKIKINLFKFS